MSERDVQLLEAVGLSPVRAAFLLGISRQAVYEGLKKEKDYLDETRMVRIVRALRDQEDPRDLAIAASLESAIAAKVVKPMSLTAQENPRATCRADLRNQDYRLVFARNPAELNDPNYLDGLMQGGIFTEARLVAYFLADKETARLLWQLIQRTISRHIARQMPRILIFETNLARALPDIALTRTRLGDWVGRTHVVKCPGNCEGDLTAEYVARLKLLVDAAGFATSITDDPNVFGPPSGTAAYDGFTFVRLFDSLCPDGLDNEVTT